MHAPVMKRDFIDQDNRITATRWKAQHQNSVATMAFPRVKAVEALNTNKQTHNCNSELLKILMTLNLVIVVVVLLRKIKKSVFFQGQLFSNMVKIKLFLADTNSYVSLDLNKIASNEHLFKLTGELLL